MFFRLSFVTLAFALVALGTPVKRDAATVELDIRKLDTQTQTLDKSVNAFPDNGGTLIQVSAIQEAATNLATSIKTTTDDVTASAVFTKAEAAAIIEFLQTKITPDVTKGLDDLVKKRSAFSADHATEFVESDLKTLKTDTAALGVALMAKTSADKQNDVREQFSTMDGTFTSAINAYSDS